MGFLLASFGKLAAGRRYRSLQVRLAHVTSQMTRCQKQIQRVNDFISKSQQRDKNNLSIEKNYCNNMMQSSLIQKLREEGYSEADIGKLQSNLTSNTLNTSTETDTNLSKILTRYNQLQTSYKSGLDSRYTTITQNQEDYYDNVKEALLEPLKQKDEALTTEKESLESLITAAKAEYDGFKEMEKSEGQNLKPQYGGVA